MIAKRVHIGHKDLPHAIDYQVTFTIPDGEKPSSAQFEALTGYIPAEFDHFEVYNTDKGVLEELSDGPGEQRRPVVFSTADGAYAMGVYAPGVAFARLRAPELRPLPLQGGKGEQVELRLSHPRSQGHRPRRLPLSDVRGGRNAGRRKDDIGRAGGRVQRP